MLGGEFLPGAVLALPFREHTLDKSCMVPPCLVDAVYFHQVNSDTDNHVFPRTATNQMFL
jgi:hypothetical protein